MSDSSGSQRIESDPGGAQELQADPGAFLPEGTSTVVDVAVLTAIEHELDAVDDALAAIDAGDLGRSPLLVELLGADGAPARSDRSSDRPTFPPG